MGKRQQITITLSKKLIKELETLREQTGIPISQQVELRLKGYNIIKSEDNSGE